MRSSASTGPKISLLGHGHLGRDRVQDRGAQEEALTGSCERPSTSTSALSLPAADPVHDPLRAAAVVTGVTVESGSPALSRPGARRASRASVARRSESSSATSPTPTATLPQGTAPRRSRTPTRTGPGLRRRGWRPASPPGGSWLRPAPARAFPARRPAGKRPRHRLRPDEGHRADRGVVNQRVDSLLPPWTTFSTPSGTPASENSSSSTGQGVRGDGFSTIAAGGDGERREPERDHPREVERRDRGHHSERVPVHGHVDAAGDLVERLPCISVVIDAASSTTSMPRRSSPRASSTCFPLSSP